MKINSIITVTMTTAGWLHSDCETKRLILEWEKITDFEKKNKTADI